MSYTKITIGGRERGWKFNKLAQYELAKRTDLNNLEITVGYALFYAGLKANCFVKQEDPDFDFELACEWFDELDDTQVEAIKNAFTESQFYINALPKEDIKKKRGR